MTEKKGHNFSLKYDASLIKYGIQVNNNLISRYKINLSPLNTQKEQSVADIPLR